MGKGFYRYILPILFSLTIVFSISSIVLTDNGLNIYVGSIISSYDVSKAEDLIIAMNTTHNILESEIEPLRIAQILSGSSALILEAMAINNYLRKWNSRREWLLKTTPVLLVVLGTLSIMYIPLIHQIRVILRNALNTVENSGSIDVSTLNNVQERFNNLIISLSTYTFANTLLLYYTHIALAYIMFMNKHYLYVEQN